MTRVVYVLCWLAISAVIIGTGFLIITHPTH